MSGRLALGAAVVTAAVLLAGCASSPTVTPVLVVTATATPAPTPSPTLEISAGRLLVEVGQGTFVVDVADDATERAVGLSGRDRLDDGEGMWFDLGVERKVGFWMRGMLIPLDMIWVDAGLEVVAVSADVPVPAPGTEAGELALYGPDVPVSYVLEINAGLASELGIEPGMRVTITGP